MNRDRDRIRYRVRDRDWDSGKAIQSDRYVIIFIFITKALP